MRVLFGAARSVFVVATAAIRYSAKS